MPRPSTYPRDYTQGQGQQQQIPKDPGPAIGRGYYNPYGYSQSARQAQPSNPWTWGQKAVGMAAEANQPIRDWQMGQMQGFQPQYGQGPQTGFQMPQFGQQAGNYMQQLLGYGGSPYGADPMQMFGGNMGTVQPQGGMPPPQQVTGGRPPAGGLPAPPQPGGVMQTGGMGGLGGLLGGGAPTGEWGSAGSTMMGGQQPQQPVGGGVDPYFTKLQQATGQATPPPPQGGGLPPPPSQQQGFTPPPGMGGQMGGGGLPPQTPVPPPVGQGGQIGGGQWDQPVGYEGTPPMQQTPMNIPGGPQMDLQTLLGSQSAVEQARQTGLEQAMGMATGGIPQQEIQRAIQMAQAPIQQAGQQAMESEVSRLASTGWGGGGMADKARAQAMAQTQGQLGRTASDIALQGMGQSLAARQAGIGALGDIARGERGAEQAGLQALLGGGELGQRGALGAASLGLEEQLGMGQLGLGGREAGIGESLGQRGLDLQSMLQGGQLGLGQQRLGLERELGTRGMSLQEQMQPAELGLREQLGMGQLGLGQYGAESQRMQNLLQAQLGGYGAQTQRMGTMGQLGLGAEQQQMNALMQNRGYNLQEMLGQRGMDIQQQGQLGQQGYQYWQLPQQIQAQLAQTWMRGQMQPEQPSIWNSLLGGIGQGIGQAGTTWATGGGGGG